MPGVQCTTGHGQSHCAECGRFASGLDCRDDTECCARSLAEEAVEAGAHSGKRPVDIAASALYGAGQLTGERMTQDEGSAVASV